LFLWRELQRIRVALPDTVIIVIAGHHDTPRSAETGTILRLYEALGVEVVVDKPRRIHIPKLDCAVLAVPTQALTAAERPALRPEPGATLNVLLLHGLLEEVLGPEESAAEYWGATVTRAEIAPAQWDYVALGDYHVAHQVAANAWYSGSLEYVNPRAWVQLREEGKRKHPGKGYLLVDLPGGKATFRHIPTARRHIDLPPVQGAGLTAKEIDEQIAARVAKAKPSIDDQVVRLMVYGVSRATARELDHAAIRGYKARALNFHLDVRRPDPVNDGSGSSVPAPTKRLTLPETVKDFLSRRLLDADVDREEFVRLGVGYIEAAEREAVVGDGGEPPE
jgi:DNA repair exonuclease SbcCD nuclease subunit